VASPVGPVAPAPAIEPSKPESNAGSEKPVAKEEVVTVTVTDITDRVEAALKATDNGVGLIPKVNKPELKGELPKDKIMYLNQDAYVYKEPNEKSQRTWLLKKGQAFLVETQSSPEGWIFVKTKDGKKGYVRDIVLTPDTPPSK
jgi:hypothetical protein